MRQEGHLRENQWPGMHIAVGTGLPGRTRFDNALTPVKATHRSVDRTVKPAPAARIGLERPREALPGTWG